MQQNVIENEFNREHAPLATLQPCMAIEFTVKSANDLYFDLNNSRLHVIAKITKADGTNIDANTAAPINLTLHSIFREIGLELNSRNVGDTSQLYPYRSVLERLINFCKEVQETRFLSEGWTKDLIGHMNVTAVGGKNAGLNARAATFARSTLVELICRHHSDVFLPRAPYSFKYRSPHNVDSVTERLCLQVGSSSCKCSARKLQAGYPKRQSHYSHQEAYQHGPQGAIGSFTNAEYGASFIARLNDAFVDPRKPDLYQLRKRFYCRPTGFSRSWCGERCRSRGILPEEPVQFSKFCREPHWA